MDKLVFVYVSEPIAQAKLGWIGRKTGVYLKGMEKIAEATEGAVYIGSDDGIAHKIGFYELKEKVTNIIIEKAFESYRNGEIATNVTFSVGGLRQNVPIVDLSELETKIREEYEKFIEKKREEEKREKILAQQWQTFKESKAFALYNTDLSKYLSKEDEQRYEELYDKIRCEELGDELQNVIAELEMLYERAKDNKREKELKNAFEKISTLREELKKLEEKYEILKEFVAEKYIDEFREWYSSMKRKEIEQQIDEEIDEILDW